MAKKFSPGGLGGPGTTGALGNWDFIGKALDKANPYLDTSGIEHQKLLEEIAAKWDGKLPPELEKLVLQNPEWLQDLEAATIEGVADVKWEGADAATVDGTAFDDISSDPRLREDQMATLGALQELVDGGGMNAVDKANLARIQSQTGQADRGRREAILQNAAQRGMGGSGMELLAQLDSSQAATDRAAQEGLDVAGMAQQRALEAMMSKGQMAGSIRGQDFSEAAQRAAAMDAISRFNAGNTQQNNQFNASGAFGAQTFNADKNLGTQKFNAGQTQAADQFSITGKQNTHNTGIANNNAATTYNTTELPQKQFDNEVKLEEKKDQAKLGVGQGKLDQTAQKAKNLQGAAGIVGMFMSDERKKKDVKNVDKVDMDTFLASLEPKKYKYKDEQDGQGDFTGIMAQDLLKSKVGRDALMQDDEGNLGYDKDKMQGVILAALKHLSDKIDRKG
jgi:hypothetical protein